MRYDKAEIFISKYDDPLTVSFEYYGGSPAVMYLRNGDPGYPSEPPEIDINSAKLDGVDVFGMLTVEEQGELLDACFEWVTVEE